MQGFIMEVQRMNWIELRNDLFILTVSKLGVIKKEIIFWIISFALVTALGS